MIQDSLDLTPYELPQSRWSFTIEDAYYKDRGISRVKLIEELDRVPLHDHKSTILRMSYTADLGLMDSDELSDLVDLLSKL